MTDPVTIKSIFSCDTQQHRRTYIIAEIGINHEGNVDRCAEMIRAFVSAGADAVKLQTVSAARSYAPGTESYEIFSRAELSEAETANMFQLTRCCGAEPFTTSGDLHTLNWVDKLNPVAHKISSGLLSCTPIVDETCRLGRPVLISTGMSDDSAIDSAVTLADSRGCRAGLFQCTSEYPCPPEHLNLSTIRALEQRHGLPVGFSDHSSGVAMAPLAVAAGARLIEKHVTFDKTRKGFDHPISLSADEFATMVAAVRLAEIVLGQPEKIADKSVQQQAKRYQRRLAAAHDLTAGHKLSLEDFLFMRFSAESDAIAAGETDKVIGRELNRPCAKGAGISWQCLS